MKAQIKSEFFCSYFYHSAVTNLDSALKIKHPPDNYYHGIAAIILFHCTMESYINFMIYKHSLASHRISLFGKELKLIELSIKQKWLQVPNVLANQTFNQEHQPFLDFKEFIGFRNKLVHFKTDKVNIEVQLPKNKMTVGEIREFINRPGALSGHILLDIMPFAVTGKNIVHGMMRELHEMIGSKRPEFLDGSEVILGMKIIKN